MQFIQPPGGGSQSEEGDVLSPARRRILKEFVYDRHSPSTGDYARGWLGVFGSVEKGFEIFILGLHPAVDEDFEGLARSLRKRQHSVCLQEGESLQRVVQGERLDRTSSFDMAYRRGMMRRG